MMRSDEMIDDQVVPTMCSPHCGGTCLLRVHTQAGRITRVETDRGDEPQLRACLRGRALRQRVYSPDRILYPMERTGERGEGKFKRITWDRALDRVAAQLKHVRNTYGPEAVLFVSAPGDQVTLNTPSTVNRLLALTGGFSTRYGTASFQAGMFASFINYGTIFCSSTRDDLLNSRLIIMWGWDPASSMNGTNTSWYLAKAKENGTHIIAVDPYFSDSTAILADRWIPLRPGTDCAMLLAMAHVMVSQGLQDQTFLDTYTVGFDLFQKHILGQDDGIPKTPQWAEAITGVSAGTIEKLAREYATTRPAAFMAGIAPGRTAFGEQYHRAAITLAAMTGNIGINGGDAAARSWESTRGGYPFFEKGLRSSQSKGRNPIEKTIPGIPQVPGGEKYPHIHFAKVADAILKGKKGGYPADYKLLFIASSNYVNSMPDTNKIIKALKALDFIVIEEQYMTATAKYADIILPTTSFVEREDINLGVSLGYCGFQRKIIEPLGECKSQDEIARELAARLGAVDYDNRSAEERLKEMAERLGVPDYETFRREGVHRIKGSEPYVAFKKQIADPANNPFPTPSGKIEIYSRQLADLQNPLLPPIPKYIETWESRNDPLAGKYPLQLLTKHSKRRANAQFDTVPWLKELIPQSLLINSRDAHDRGIQDGDPIRVFNDRGAMIVPANVTERIMPGVAILPAGAWYAGDKNGIDRGGCANVLTRDEPSPGGAFAYNTVLVQVEKAIER